MKVNPLPIGLVLSQTAKLTTRCFDDALVSAGGTLAHWLVLQALQGHRGVLQSELALIVGVQGPTLTHHLNGLEDQGLVTRARTPADRRNHLVAITVAGQTRYAAMRQTAQNYDDRLRTALTTAEMVQFRGLLARIGAAATASAP
jgi:MarR family transcriptional regulator, transcriptional regulator for hemolysin